MINVGILTAILRLKDEMGPQLRTASQRLGDFAKKSALVFAAIVAASAIAFGAIAGKAIEASSRAEETANLFRVSFGDMADSAEAWVQRTSAAVKVNDTTFQKFSGTIFNFVTSMGVARDAAFDMSTGVTQLTADFASFHNIDFDTAFNKIQAGLAGEVEGLRRLGKDVSVATIEQTEFAQAILATGRELTESEKIQARWIAILEQSKNEMGDLLLTQDSWANVTRSLSETWVDFLETFGDTITQSSSVKNMLVLVSNAVIALTGWVKNNQDAMMQWINIAFFALLELGARSTEMLGGLAVAIGFVSERIGAGNAMLLGGVKGLEEYEAKTGTLSKKMQEFGADLIHNATVQREWIQGQIDGTGTTKENSDALEEWLAVYRDFVPVVGGAGDAVGELTTKTGELTEAGKRLTEEFNREAIQGIALALPEVKEGMLDVTQEQVKLIDNLRKTNAPALESFGTIIGGIEETKEHTTTWNNLLSETAGLFQILNISAESALGRIIGLSQAALAGTKRLLEAISSGDILGIVSSGITLAGAGIQAILGLGGRNADTVKEEIARDMGVAISDGLAEAIHRAGQNPQLSLARIFSEGGMGIDRFAEEFGDFFSLIEDGAITSAEGIQAMGENAQTLIQRFGELGPEGVGQIERIVNAAERLGVEFEGLEELQNLLEESIIDTADEAIAAFQAMGGSVDRWRDHLIDGARSAELAVSRLIKIMGKVNLGQDLNPTQERFLGRVGLPPHVSAQGGLHTGPLTGPLNITAHRGETVDIDRPGRQRPPINITYNKTMHVSEAPNTDVIIHKLTSDGTAMQELMDGLKRWGL